MSTMLNAKVTQCDLIMKEHFEDGLTDKFQLFMKFSCPESFKRDEEIIINIADISLDSLLEYKIKHEPNQIDSLILIMLQVFEVNSFSEIEGKYCRLIVNEDNKVIGLNHILHKDEYFMFDN